MIKILLFIRGKLISNSKIPLQQIKKFGIMDENDDRKVGWGQIYGEI